ncbi:MAG TPA: hypothetical protein VF629_03715 [Hymenobacter sp.]|jgi:hypothetical protein|uniref:hypothetical protein n=1 Tax=Hymenobacter sp. TaxID=1898978 RepID=UPI002ED9123D
MSNEYALWKQDLRRAVGGLCDLLFPVGAGGAGAAEPSFLQALRYLYQECRFPAFVALEAWRQAGLNAAAGAELAAFMHRLDAYDEPDSDDALWADPRWLAIRRHAARVHALLV